MYCNKVLLSVVGVTNVLFACHMVTQFSSAVTPIMSLPPVMHIIEKIERASTFLWFIILCKIVVLDTAHCTSLGLYDLEVIQWGSIYSNTVYNPLHFKHRYFFLSILILSSALTPLVQTTSLLSFSTHYSILIFSGIFFIFSEFRSDTSQRLKWRPQSRNREWRSQSWHLHH